MRLLLLEAKLWLKFRVCNWWYGYHLRSEYCEDYDEHGWRGYWLCSRCLHRTPAKCSPLHTHQPDRLSVN